MDRDVLLVLLVIGVLLNTGLLLLVALLRAAPWRDAEPAGGAVAARPPGRPDATRHRHAGPVTRSPRWTPLGGAFTGGGALTRPPAVDPLPLAPVAPVAPNAGAQGNRRPGSPRSDGGAGVSPPSASSEERPITSGGNPEPVAGAPDGALATAAVTPPPADEAEVAPAPSAASTAASLASVEPVSPDDEQPTPAEPPIAEPGTRPAPPKRTRPARAARPRRFTMPDLEEDHDRAARSIAAFLGEPVAPSAGPRPHRRRHRARRPAGAGIRTDVILVLAGQAPSARVGHAIAAALRDVVRESDEVVELPGGRLRVSLDADDAGADVFVDRARSVVRPWLELVGPALELEVERPAAETHRQSAAS